MTKNNRILLFLALMGQMVSAYAAHDESRMLSSLKDAFPGTKFSSVTRTPISGVYEVWMGQNVAYVSSKNLRYFLFGKLFDAENMLDLTTPKLAKAQRFDEEPTNISFETLPLVDAIKTVRGDGSRALAVFSDPTCHYCKRLEPELSKLTNITIYTFLVPFQGMNKPLAIWCAVDREKAWHQHMLDADASLLNAEANCPNPLERNLALTRKIGIRGTPTIIFSNGKRLDGYTDVAEIESHLGQKAASATTQSIKEKL